LTFPFAVPAFIPAYTRFGGDFAVGVRYEKQVKRYKISALGRADLDAVYVEHPIQDQTRQEIAAKAEAVIGEIVARLTIVAASGSELAPSEAASK
jgi:hypothetical protein